MVMLNRVARGIELDRHRDLASAEAKNIRDSLSRMLSDDLFAEFLAQLENEIGVNINQAALRQVITGARGDIDDN